MSKDLYKIKKLVENEVKSVFAFELLLEADVKDKLMKIGLPEDLALKFKEKFGKLAVWFYNALKDHLVQFNFKDDIINNNGKFLKNYLKVYEEEITGILDWMKHPTIAGRLDLRNLTFKDALAKARKFHKDLEAGIGDINYKETNPIFIQYDNGFYWAKIESNYSELEHKRMGHCGKTTKGDCMFSLRSNAPYGKNSTINDSHVTVAYNSNDNIVYQSKGKHNNQADAQYAPYIFDLIMKLPVFKGFGREYKSELDYGFSDINNKDLKKLYKKHPEAFNSYSAQKYLVAAKIIEKTTIKGIQVHWDIDDIERFVDIDRDHRSDLIKIVLTDPWQLFDHSDSYVDGLDSLDEVNDKNKKIILSWFKKQKFSKDEIEYSKDFEELIKNNEEIFEDVIRCVKRARQDAEDNGYEVYYIKQIEKALEYYGDISNLNDEGVDMFINVQDKLDDIGDDEWVNDMMEYCHDNLYDVFYEAVQNGYIDKPKLSFDNRWYPDVSETFFNEVLTDLLHDELN